MCKLLFIMILMTFIEFHIYRAGGTAGAVVTCPLEVVKTRLQSSVRQFTNKSVYIRQVI